MRKKLGVVFFLCLFAFLFTSCDEVLSVVTLDENGEKIVNNYVSTFSDTVYDESISFKSWHDIELFEETDILEKDELLFKIENKKENIVVLGDEESAIEISFFEGGYKYKLFTSMDSLSELFNF
ncbi:MAG: hypothetical protein ACTTHG_00025 [Treponemataceae bacterium]